MEGEAGRRLPFLRGSKVEESLVGSVQWEVWVRLELRV